MTGEPSETAAWLNEIEAGGDLSQTNEEKALVSMTDFWKTAPVGWRAYQFAFNGRNVGSQPFSNRRADSGIAYYLLGTKCSKSRIFAGI